MPRGQEKNNLTKNKSSPGSADKGKYNQIDKKDSNVRGLKKETTRKQVEDLGEDRGESSIGSSSRNKPGVAPRHMRLEGHSADLLDETTSSAQGDIRADRPSTGRRGHPESSGASSAYIDQQVQRKLQERKSEIIESLMAYALECLDKKLEMFEERCDEGAESCTSPRRRQCSSQRSPNMLTVVSQSAGHKRQLQREGDEEEEQDVDSDSVPRSKNSKRAKTARNGQLRFACPYYKFDPQKFGNARTCCGPGFTEINRLKEHLLRRHRRFNCSRCYKLFTKEEDLKLHQRRQTPCTVKSQNTAQRDFRDGFDQEQEKELRKRLRLNEEDKWAIWYCILFRIDRNSSNLPYPYFEKSETEVESPKSQASGKYAKYCDYMRRVLPPKFESLITAEVNRATVGLEDQVKRNIWDSLHDLPMKLHRVFQNIQPPPGSDEDEDSAPCPPIEAVDDIFECLPVGPGDGFDFGSIVPYATEPTDVSSHDSSLSSADTALYSNTSDTSFEIDDASKTFSHDGQDSSYHAGYDFSQFLNES